MKALILGATGMLGHQVFLKFKKSGKFSSVKAAAFEKWESVEKYGIFQKKEFYGGINFFDDGFDVLKGIISKDKPDVIVNCVVLKPKKEPREKFLLLNSFLPHYLAKLLNAYGGKFIQISTDGVFSGKKGFYSENDIPDAIDLYGVSKYFGEVDYGNNLTIRTSIFGHELLGKKGLLEWFLHTGKSSQGYTNVYFSGVSTNFLAETIIKLFSKKTNGLINIASEKKIKKLELLRLVDLEYDLKKKLIPIKANIKIDRSLNPKKMAASGIVPPDYGSMIASMRQEYLKNINFYGC